MSTRSPNKVNAMMAGVKKGLKAKVAAKAPKPKPPTKKELAAAKAKEEKRLLRR